MIFTDEIGHIDETGFVDSDGEHHDVDVFICATGFDTSWVPRFPLINGEGVDLRDMWDPKKTAGAGGEGMTYLLQPNSAS